MRTVCIGHHLAQQDLLQEPSVSIPLLKARSKDLPLMMILRTAAKLNTSIHRDITGKLRLCLGVAIIPAMLRLD
jgi:hypothetical protein